MAPKSRSHHLDRRAERLLEEESDGQPDDLLSTAQLAAWLGVSRQWVEVGRSRNYGPPFIRLSPRRVRYRRRDVLDWLNSRTCRHSNDHGEG